MKKKNALPQEEASGSKEAKQKKGRAIKIIFTPLSLIFYVGIGYMIYRRIRRSQQEEPKPIIATA